MTRNDQKREFVRSFRLISYRFFTLLAAFAVAALTSAPTHAGTLNISATVDANVQDNTGTGTFTQVTSASGDLDIRDFAARPPISSIERSLNSRHSSFPRT